MCSSNVSTMTLRWARDCVPMEAPDTRCVTCRSDMRALLFIGVVLATCGAADRIRIAPNTRVPQEYQRTPQLPPKRRTGARSVQEGVRGVLVAVCRRSRARFACPVSARLQRYSGCDGRLRTRERRCRSGDRRRGLTARRARGDSLSAIVDEATRSERKVEGVPFEPFEPHELYSARKTAAGSTRVARHTGTSAAIPAAVHSTHVDVVSDSQSRGLTP